MIQANLFSDEVLTPYKISFSFNQEIIIQNILELYVKGDIDLDPTYSKGNFYKSGRIKDPKYKFDLTPQTADTKRANFINLPLEDASISCVMFDPPFLIHIGTSGKIKTRFSCFKDLEDLKNSYYAGLIEFYRILKPSGWLIFKCQDFICSGKQNFSHIDYVYNPAKQIGYKAIDLLIRLSKNKIQQAHWKN